MMELTFKILTVATVVSALWVVVIGIWTLFRIWKGKE